jgi:hypothetical protein
MGLGEEPSVNHFSDSQIRDLFRLDTDTFCQTHDLLRCKCSVSINIMKDKFLVILSNTAGIRKQRKI